MKVNELIEEQAWVVWNLLTVQECQDLVQAATEADIASMSAPGDRRDIATVYESRLTTRN
jgi:hypothetical protein